MVASPSFELVSAALGAWHAGATLVLIAIPPRTASQQQWRTAALAQLDSAGARLLVETRPGSTLQLDEVPVLRPDPDGASGGHAAAVDPSMPAVITFTSGTTGAPRGIVLSHRALADRNRTHAGWSGHVDPDRHSRLGWTPLHQWGLITEVTCAMAHGVDCTLLPTQLFTADPGRWLLEISRTKATYSSAPTFAYGLVASRLERGLAEPIDLSGWQLAVVAGETADHATLTRFATAAAAHGFDSAALSATYGLNEAGGVTGRPPGSGLRVDHVDRQALTGGRASPAGAPGGAATFVSVGPPRKGFQLEIRDAQGAVLPERHVGEVIVAGPAMDCYLDDPEATAAVLRDGWVHTGDLGYLADGELFVTGRAKDVIIVNGRNYHATDIERVAGPGATAIAIPGGATEVLVLVVEAPTPEPILIDHIRLAVYTAIGITPADVVIVPPGTVPRTEHGKPQRAAARSRYLEGSLTTGKAP